MGSLTPKQYLKLAGKPVLRHTLESFLAVPLVKSIVTVINDQDQALYADAVDGIESAVLAPPVFGGADRSSSVRNGLEALVEAAPDIVLIHDAARPFCSETIIVSVAAACASSDGAVAALPVVDALWRSQGEVAEAPVSRENLWRAQTPQGFRFASILAAHRNCSLKAAADDVEIARQQGMQVQIVFGDEDNFKITSPEDLERAERMVDFRLTRA